MAADTPSRIDPRLAAGNRRALAGYRATHFRWQADGGVATITLDRAERRNPLTFDSYAELRDLFAQLRYADDVHAVVVTAPAATSARAATCTRSSARWCSSPRRSC